jgi:hypothetical protein
MAKPNLQRQLRVAIDGTHVQDNFQVVFKKVPPEEGPYNLSINQLFSSPDHCIPLSDVLEQPLCPRPRTGGNALPAIDRPNFLPPTFPQDEIDPTLSF